METHTIIHTHGPDKQKKIIRKKNGGKKPEW